MLRRLSLAAAVAAATGVAWAAQPTPLPTKTDLISVYKEAVDNNADLAAAQADYLARKEVVPQARAGLLPQLGAGARVGDLSLIHISRRADQDRLEARRAGDDRRSRPRADAIDQGKHGQAAGVL